MSYKNFVWISTSFLFLTNLLDFVFTDIAVTRFGTEIELNPAMRYLIEHHTIWSLLFIKCFFIGILLLLALRVKEVNEQNRVKFWTLFTCGTYFCLTIYHVINYVS